MNIFSDPTDDLIAASLYGELTPEEEAAVQERLLRDPAFARRHQETQTMHTLLTKNYHPHQPDSGFVQRIVDGVQRRLRQAPPRDETPWESLLFLASYLRPVGLIGSRYALPLVGLALTLGLASIYTLGGKSTSVFSTINDQLSSAQSGDGIADKKKDDFNRTFIPPMSSPGQNAHSLTRSAVADVPDMAKSVGARAPSNEMANAPAPQFQAAFKSKSILHQHQAAGDQASDGSSPGDAGANAALDAPSRKLVRDATLRLEVNDFSAALDRITQLTKNAGGYLESESSQRGGNGKLQGTVVAKVLPEQLDSFLLQLRELGELKNQNVNAQDITSAYYDLQARLDNQRRMEASLQELLQKDNGKVSDLLQVERELGRVRGEIEAMQGQLKLYNFQVAFATVTITLAEKDLHAAAAYLLKENDQLTLLANDVDAAFQQAKKLADSVHGQIRNANLNRDANANVTATLDALIPPEQIESFLTQVQALGRVGSITRTTQRVANDGGDSSEPADPSKTIPDQVEVNLTISSQNDEPVAQTAQLSVLGSDIEAQARKLKENALSSGVVIKSSTFSHQADGQEIADLSFKLPEDKSGDFLAQLKALGSVESYTLQRQDPVQGPGGNAPMEIDFHFHSRADLVSDDTGLFAMLRHTFSEGFGALLGSIGAIAVFLAFVLPWVLFLCVLAWIARRVYLVYRK